MTIPHDTTAKLIGLAATGAAMLGLSLEDALLTAPEALSRYIRTLTGKSAPATAPAEEDPAVLTALGLPATPAAQPELALGYEPTPAPAGAHGILARAAKLSQNTTPQA